MPWARGYQLVQKPGAKNMLFSMTRNASRESLFNWVGPITSGTDAFFALKSKGIKINNSDEIKNYKIAGIRGDVGLISAAELGVKESSLHTVNKFDQLPTLLKKGRADLFVYGDKTGFWLLKNSDKYNVSNYEVVYSIQPPSQVYYAFNLSVDNKIISQFQTALDEVMKDKAFVDQVLKKYAQ